MITYIQYKDDINDNVKVMFSDGRAWNQKLSVTTPYSAEISAWIANPANTVLPRRTAAKLYDIEITKLNKLRDQQYKNMVVAFNGHNITAGEKQRLEINGVCTSILMSRLSGAADTPVVWTTDDNVDVTFTMDEMLQIGSLVAQTYAQIHKTTREAKLAV